MGKQKRERGLPVIQGQCLHLRFLSLWSCNEGQGEGGKVRLLRWLQYIAGVSLKGWRWIIELQKMDRRAQHRGARQGQAEQGGRKVHNCTSLAPRSMAAHS